LKIKHADAAASKHPFPTKSTRISGELLAASVAASLVRASQWFELTPLPDDQFDLTYKPDAHVHVERTMVESGGLKKQVADILYSNGESFLGDDDVDIDVCNSVATEIIGTLGLTNYLAFTALEKLREAIDADQAWIKGSRAFCDAWNQHAVPILNAGAAEQPTLVVYISGGNLQDAWSNVPGIAFKKFDDDVFDSEVKDDEGRTKEEFETALKEATDTLDHIY
jgi:hypothetical protein